MTLSLESSLSTVDPNSSILASFCDAVNPLTCSIPDSTLRWVPMDFLYSLHAGSSHAKVISRVLVHVGQHLRARAVPTSSQDHVTMDLIERDAALERRFELVQVAQPSVEKAIEMMRGL